MTLPVPDWYPGRGAWRFRNATRAFDFTPTLDSILIAQEHPEALATLTARVVDEDASLVFANEDECWSSFTPDGGVEARIWAGFISVPGETSDSEVGPRVWDLTGTDYTSKLDDALIRRQTKRKREKVRRRVRWLLSYLRPSIWTLDGIELDLPDVYVEAFDYYGQSVREALQQVADERRLFFYVDLDNVFHMFRTETIPSPFDLDNEAPDFVTTFPLTEWSRSPDSTELANAILVEPEKRADARWTRDAPSIAAYHRQERFISDPDLAGRQQAENVGERAIAQSSEPEEDDTTCVVKEPGIRAGMRVHVREALWDHDFDRIVKGVEIRAVDPHDEDGNAMLYSVLTLTDRRPARISRGSDAGNRDTRGRPGRTADTDPRPIDDFPTDVAPPTITTGTTIAATIGARTGVSRGVTLAGADDGPVVATSPSLSFVQSSIGHEPSYEGANTHRGWWERETWYHFTVPTHPASMAGIRGTFALFAGEGYGGASGVPIEVVTRSSAPTDIRQGSLVGTIFAAGGVVDFPAGLIPAAAGEMWIGFRPGWQADYGAFATGYFVWPYQSSPSQLDSNAIGYMGRSGRLLSPVTMGPITWLVFSSPGGSLPVTASPARAPFQGGNAYQDAGSTGSPIVSVDDGALILEASEPSSRAWTVVGSREDDDEPTGAWSDVAWGWEGTFSIDVAGEEGDPGTRSLEVVTVGEGERTIGTVHLGDGDFATGVSVGGPTPLEYDPVSITTDDHWRVLFDSRSGEMRAKLWKATSRMPANWNVRTLMAETEDDADRFTFRLSAGNDGGPAQTLRLFRHRYLPVARPGSRVVRELIGRADGLTKRFYPAHRHRPGSLRILVNGTSVAPELEDEESYLWGQLDWWPTPGSTIRATYITDD